MAIEWKLRSATPFFSEKARTRAPQIIDYAAVPGAAFLVSPRGEIELSGGAAFDVDLGRVARTAAAFGAANAQASFSIGTTCVHATPVCDGWFLCLLSSAGAPPALVIERANKAARVLAMALVHGGGGRSSDGSNGSGGAPAEARVDQKPRVAWSRPDALPGMSPFTRRK